MKIILRKIFINKNMLIVRRYSSLSLRPLALSGKTLSRSFSDKKKDDSDSDSDREVKTKSKKQPVKEETAADRLNKLLSSMQTDDNLTKVKQVNMAKPGGGKKSQKKEDDSNTVLQALKNVASHLGEENKQQTESELLNKLLMHSEEPSATRPIKDEKSNDSEVSLSDLIVGMKIDRRQPAVEYSRGDYVRKTLASRSGQRSQSRDGRDQNRVRSHQRQPEPNSGSVDLFGAKDLGIFKDPSKLRPSTDILKTWGNLFEHELKLSVTHPPANYFQKMALWTEQGKLWKFPIDNEQGLDEEAATDFSEHVLLEQHLEQWCPTKGPIRHYMELVCVGLAKNPYISAREKKEHILWYRDYFEGKKELLKEVIIEQTETPGKAKISKS